MPETGVLELDHVYETLAHPRRRYLCYTLLESNEWSLPELATKIAAWESDRAESDVDPDSQERVYVALYHTHVPKLVDEGVVTFDESAETITTAENAPQVLDALAGIGASVDADQQTHARRDFDGDAR